MLKMTCGALLAAVVLTGCSGSGSGTGAAGETTARNYGTVDEVRTGLAAANLECSGYEQNKEVLGAREDGSCKINGDTVSITIYNNADQRKQIREAFSAFGSGINVDGDKWTVNVPTNELAKQVQEALGGKIP